MGSSCKVVNAPFGSRENLHATCSMAALALGEVLFAMQRIVGELQRCGGETKEVCRAWKLQCWVWSLSFKCVSTQKPK